MALTLAQARTRIRYRIGESEASYWSDAELNSYINDSKDDLYNAIQTIKKDFFEKTYDLSVASGDYIKALPSTFGTLQVIYASGYEFISRPHSSFDFNLLQNNDLTTKIVFYDIYHKQTNTDPVVTKGIYIEFSPKFTESVTIGLKYTAELPDLSGDSATFEFLEPMLGYILDRATYYALSKGPAGDYNNYKNEAEKKLNRILGVAGNLDNSSSEFVDGFLG